MRKAKALAPVVNTPIHHAEVLAIEALDGLIGRLIKTHGQVPATFLDWVCTDATFLARHLIHQSMRDPSFARTMQSAQAEAVMLRLIGESVMPLVQQRLYETVESRSRRRSQRQNKGHH